MTAAASAPRDEAGARLFHGARFAVCAALVSALLLAVAPAAAQNGIRSRTDLRCLTDRSEDCLPEPVSRDEPHEAVCATCHDLSTQSTKAEAASTCAGSGCHTDAATSSPFHRGLGPGVLADCIRCHDPHDARVPAAGMNCELCHTAGVRYSDPRSYERHPLPGRPAGLDLTFRHRQHGSVECIRCHAPEPEHGTLRVTGRADCRSCHHTGEAASECTACHDPGEVELVAGRVVRTMGIEIGSLNRPERSLPFDHTDHTRFECDNCHRGTGAPSAAETNCSRCHGMHHEPDVTCMACHEPPAAGAHDREAHLGCAGAGCHQSAPSSVQNVPRTRQLCLVCHQDLVDHEPQATCSDCHALPPPRDPDG